MQHQEIKECPFCGSKDVEIILCNEDGTQCINCLSMTQNINPCPYCQKYNILNEHCCVVCKYCQASGPTGEKKSKAIEAWNAAPRN